MVGLYLLISHLENKSHLSQCLESGVNNIRLIMKSEPARWAKPGARILHRYGRLVPSLNVTQLMMFKQNVKMLRTRPGKQPSLP